MHSNQSTVIESSAPPSFCNLDGVSIRENEQTRSVFIQFVDTNSEFSGFPVYVPADSNVAVLSEILQDILHQDVDYEQNYEFFIGKTQILDDLQVAISQFNAAKQISGDEIISQTDVPESVIPVTYQAQAVFKVRPVTRCTSTIPGHKGAVLVAAFSPDARALATGSGDCSVRFWDLNTELPGTVGSDAHHSPVLCLSWCPDGLRLASGCQGGLIFIWTQTVSSPSSLWVRNPVNPLVPPNMTHCPTNSRGRWIRALVWRPFHLDPVCRLVAAAYQNTNIVVWDIVARRPIFYLTGHEKPVTSLRWGGSDLIYSASQDRTIRVWRGKDGTLCRRLNLHGHWVNCLALSVDYVLRTGPFDPAKALLVKSHPEQHLADEQQKVALELYHKVKGGGPERLVAGSDDNTLSLWQPEVDEKPLCPRMVGHQAVVNDVKFSPNAQIIASASFDHSVKLWDGHTGQFIATMFGHVQEVYLIAWSSDSRLIVSGSKDSTLKLWSVEGARRWCQEGAAKGVRAATSRGKEKKASVEVHQRRRHILHDLPGHADAIYALDWSPDGQRVASGGKDRLLKLWRA